MRQHTQPTESKNTGDIRLELIPLLHTCISSNGANVDHSITEFDKGTTLLGQLDIRNVLQTEIDKILILLLTQPLNETIASETLSKTVGSQAVLGKGEVKEGGDIDGRGAELFLLLGQVRTANLNNASKEGE